MLSLCGLLRFIEKFLIGTILLNRFGLYEEPSFSSISTKLESGVILFSSTDSLMLYSSMTIFPLRTLICGLKLVYVSVGVKPAVNV